MPSPSEGDRMRELRVSRLKARLKEVGLPVDASTLYRAYDRQSEFLAAAWHRHEDPSPSDQVQAYLRFANLDGADLRVVEAVHESFGGALLSHAPALFPHVVDALDRLRSGGYAIGMISNTGRTWGRYLRDVQEALRIGRYFDVRVFSDEEGIRKPDRRIFDAAVSRLGLPPSDVVHVGDDVAADVGGAKSLGLRAVWFNTGFWPEADGSAADAEIHDHAQLPEVLERWRR